MGEPTRIQLSRRKGFRLQEVSLALNGLPAVNVARPSKWGNPFVIGKPHPYCRPDEIAAGCKCAEPMTRDEAVEAFAALYWSPEELAALRGRNLACHCGADQACHADTLLRLSNPTPEPADCGEFVWDGTNEKVGT